jgi:hypothetical protein
MLIHTVFFAVGANASEDAVEQLLADCRGLLSKVPGVRHLWVGRPADTHRSVVLRDYAVGMTIVFADAAAQEAYQDHPLHLEFIARNKNTWSGVRVFDVTE